MWLVSASSLRARRRAPEQVMLMTSCTCRCRTTVAAAGKLLGTFRRRARAKTELGYVVWFTVRLAATCLVMRQLVRRENASPDPDLADVCTACSCGGRCLRRARAPRARRGQLQRVCDGRGMYRGRSGGGRVLVGAMYSDFTVAQNSFALLPYWRCNASSVEHVATRSP